jgi:putative DNA primase/helicase
VIRLEASNLKLNGRLACDVDAVDGDGNYLGYGDTEVDFGKTRNRVAVAADLMKGIPACTEESAREAVRAVYLQLLDSKRAEGSSIASQTDGQIVAAPSDPMAVARAFVASRYERGREQHLRHYRGVFHSYDGACWPEAEERAIRSALYAWLETRCYEKEGEIIPWQPTVRKVNDVLDALRAVVHLTGQIDAPLWADAHPTSPPANEMVVVRNGLLHIRTLRLLSHTPTFFVHHGLAFDFDPRAPVPAKWLRFLSELWPNDPKSIDTLAEICGYILAGGTEQEKLFAVVGPRRSGKGTIGRVLTGLLGRHNVAAPTMTSLATNFGLQELIHRPLAIISDARLGPKSAGLTIVERLLSISGEDTITVDRKYKDPWTGRLPTRFLILTNEVPALADASGALAGRFVLLCLTRSFYGSENPRLTDELLAAAPGIFNWMLAGYDRLMQRGFFEMPASSEEAIVQIADLAAPVGAFLRQRCVVGREAETPVAAVWAAWKRWCEDENRHPGTKANFGRDLKAAAPLVKKIRPRTESDLREYVYAGLRLLPDGDIPGDCPDHPDHADHAGTEDGSGPGGPGGPRDNASSEDPRWERV